MRNCLTRSGGGQTPDHQATHDRIDHGFPAGTHPFILFAEAPAVPPPGNRPLSHPSPRQDCAGRTRGWLDVLQYQAAPHRGRMVVVGHPPGFSRQSLPCPRPLSPASSQPCATRGHGLFVCFGGRQRATPARSLPSAGRPCTVQRQPGVSTRSCRVRPLLCLAPSSPRAPPTPGGLPL